LLHKANVTKQLLLGNLSAKVSVKICQKTSESVPHREVFWETFIGTCLSSPYTRTSFWSSIYCSI